MIYVEKFEFEAGFILKRSQFFDAGRWAVVFPFRLNATAPQQNADDNKIMCHERETLLKLSFFSIHGVALLLK